MATRAKKKIEKTAVDIALELVKCRESLNGWKAIEKALAEDLKKRIKAGETQEYFRITTSATFKVENKELALSWAQKFAPQVITVDATSARKIFLGDVATNAMGSAEQNGFGFKETEKLIANGETEE